MRTYYRCTAAFLWLIGAGVLFAQNTTVQLSTQQDSLSSFRVLNNAGVVQMLVNSDGGIYGGGEYTIGCIPKTGIGARMMWYPKKAAFRAGFAATEWDDQNIGDNSVAFGSYVTASGTNSTALGKQTTASGIYSFAEGWSSTASGPYSTAMGHSAVASGLRAVAIGSGTTASGDHSTAMGYGSTANGEFSISMGNVTQSNNHSTVAMGDQTVAGGISSMAIGYMTSANGDFSTALGCHVKANHEGSFIIGDRSKGTPDSSSAIHQMTMRFSGGYRLFTNSTATVGCSLAAGGNSWSVISDSSRKELFSRANGELFLDGIAKLRLGSWNYKGQEPKYFRHYGPMAQEIFRYFGRDAYGIIGNDTTLASSDMDGLMMICLQALEKRTRECIKIREDLACAVSRLEESDRKLTEYSVKMERLENKLRTIEEMIASKPDSENRNITYGK